jgi:hypothetical protein
MTELHEWSIFVCTRGLDGHSALHTPQAISKTKTPEEGGKRKNAAAELYGGIFSVRLPE